MRHTVSRVALASALGITGTGAGAVLGPALATAATGDQTASAAVGDRVERIKTALSGLVIDGTLTQAQADKVATTLDERLPARGSGGHGGGARLAAAATALGVTEAELRTQLQAGKSLADVAQAEGVELDTLVSALVTAAEQRLAQAVTDGRLTQAQADERKAELQERITEQVQRTGLGRGPGHGSRGDADSNGSEQATPSPSASATPS